MVFLCPFLGIACLWDYGMRKIPNLLVFIIWGLGLIEAFSIGGIKVAAVYLAKNLVLMICFFPLFSLGMIGGGDVKMISIVAGYFELNRILDFLLCILFISAVIGVIEMLGKRQMRERIIYLKAYLQECIWTKSIKPYATNRKERIRTGVVMSGPILISTVLGIGGLF